MSSLADKLTLTAAQRGAVDGALRALDSGCDLFRIGGYAGTGKTTLSKWILNTLERVAVCAFTGKAASVLRSKGLNGATTIHKRIYRYDLTSEKFILRPRSELQHVDCFLLDEASMVNSTQWEDMRSFGKPIIAIGDPGQLEPVGDDPRLMHEPDVVLTEIHRQAQHSEIVKLATHVRHGGTIEKQSSEDVIVDRKDLFWDSLEWADVCLCGFNATRVNVNNRIRQLRFKKEAKRKIVEGETIVCLRNDQRLGVSNGELFTVTRVITRTRHGWMCELESWDGDVLLAEVLELAFGVGKPDLRNIRSGGVMLADYGYCLTVHKFQGSEADRVAVMHEQCGKWCPIRHSYTAITRAARELRYAI